MTFDEIEAELDAAMTTQAAAGVKIVREEWGVDLGVCTGKVEFQNVAPAKCCALGAWAVGQNYDGITAVTSGLQETIGELVGRKFGWSDDEFLAFITSFDDGDHGGDHYEIRAMARRLSEKHIGPFPAPEALDV